MRLYSDSTRATYYGIVSTKFISALVSPDPSQSAMTDLRGNVKIPMIESYENSSIADSQRWFTTDKSHNVYASLAGVPSSVQNMHPRGDTAKYTMNMETSYMHLNCLSKNYTEVPGGAVHGLSAWMWSDSNDPQRFKADLADFKPRVVVFGGTCCENTVQCDITTTYVELQIECNTSSTCATSRLRRSQLDHPPPAFTLLDNYSNRGWEYYALHFVDRWWNGTDKLRLQRSD